MFSITHRMVFRVLALCGGISALTLGLFVEHGSASSAAAAVSKNASALISAARDPKIAAEVPKAIRNKGQLLFALDATYAPNEFIKSGHVIGMDADLGVALAQVMGLKATLRNVTFDAIIPGLAAKKYDVGLSSFTDTKAREKVVDFVTYFIAGTSFYTKKSGGTAVTSLAGLCGHTVAVEKGTTQAADATAQSKKCTLSRKPTVKVLTFPDQNGANLAISSGRATIGMADSPVADYIVKQSNGQFKLSGRPYATAPYGIALPKRNGMAKPMKDALLKLMNTGAYLPILKKWNVQQGAIPASQVKINGAIS